MNRRHFLGALGIATSGVFVPKLGSWFRQGTGLWRYETVREGLWTDPTTWRGGLVPEMRHNTITLGHNVTMPNSFHVTHCVFRGGPGKMVVRPHDYGMKIIDHNVFFGPGGLG